MELAAAPKGIVRDKRFRWMSTPYWGVHVAAIVGPIILGWSWTGLLLAIALYYSRMFFITAGFHRYFSHRTFRTSRVMQFLMALFGTTSTQKGVLWWAAHHRTHHKLSDQPGDVHSVKMDGFYWSHQGWILSRDYDQTDWKKIQDFAKYPELKLLNALHVVPPVALAVALYFTLGWWGLVWGYFVSTTLLWHGTFTINSLSHLIGSRRYETTDTSKNNFVLAMITLGEGWHNNHHHYQRATNNGFFWWEIDITYYLLKMMSWVGLVWDLHKPPKHVLEDTKAALAATVEAEADAAAEAEAA